jgi:hypothetical protein
MLYWELYAAPLRTACGCIGSAFNEVQWSPLVFNEILPRSPHWLHGESMVADFQQTSRLSNRARLDYNFCYIARKMKHRFRKPLMEPPKSRHAKWSHWNVVCVQKWEQSRTTHQVTRPLILTRWLNLHYTRLFWQLPSGSELRGRDSDPRLGKVRA